MVTKSLLAKKLASYSAVAAAILAIDRKADAQIVYTKLNPYDTVGYAYNPYQLDLNNDGIIDFNFNGDRLTQIVHQGTSAGYYSTTFTYNTDTNIACKPYNSNKVLLNSSNYTSFGELVKPLNAGNIISSKNISWVTGDRDLAIHQSGDSYFSEKWAGQEHYVGLQLLKNGNTYYGWAKVYIAKHSQFALIEEYGYNATPDSAVYAGQECELEYPNPAIQQNGNILSTSAKTKVLWYFNNKAIPADTLQSITTTQYGIYSVTTGDTTICHGTSLPFNYINCNTLQPSITSPADLICNYKYPTIKLDTLPPDYSVEWFINDTLVKWETGTSISAYDANFFYPYNYKFYALVSEPGGCSFTTNTINITSDTNQLSPVIKQSNDTLFIKNSNRNIPSNSTFQWYQSGDSVIAGAIKNYYVPADTGVYFVTLTDSLGCSGSVSFDYQICKNLHSLIIASNSVICPNSFVSLQVDSPPLNYTAKWFFNGSYTGNTGLTINASYVGDYYAVLYAQGGCYDTTNIINLAADTIKPIIVQHGDSLLAEPAQNHTFPPNVIFQWYRNNPILGADSSYFIATSNGYYTVSATDSLGCTLLSREYYFAFTNITPLSSADDIQVLESNNLLTIKFKTIQYNGYRLSIYNYIGQKVFSSDLNSGNTTIDLGTLAKGLYLVSVEKDNTRIVKKIVIE